MGWRGQKEVNHFPSLGHTAVIDCAIINLKRKIFNYLKELQNFEKDFYFFLLISFILQQSSLSFTCSLMAYQVLCSCNLHYTSLAIVWSDRSKRKHKETFLGENLDLPLSILTASKNKLFSVYRIHFRKITASTSPNSLHKFKVTS